MSPKTSAKLYRLALLSLTAAAFVAVGCGNGSMLSGTTSGSSTTGSAFVIGTDAPLASVISFPVTVQTAELTNSSGSTASLITGTPTVDFARYNGLQTLLDMNDVPTGTYTSVTITLGAGTIGYLNTGSGAPTVATMPATYSPASSSTVNVTLDKPLVIGSGNPPVGLRIDLDLAKSIAVDSSGAITGDVTPTFHINTVARTDTGAHIDELFGGVVTAPSGTTEPNSFVIAGPHGENFTINTTSSTTWDGAASLSALNTNSVVQVSGQLDPADQTLDADEVAIISDSGFYATGQLTYVTPASGAASSFDMYVRALEPNDISGSTGNPISLGNIAQVDLTGSEKYYIYAMHNPLTGFLFNSSALVAGQDVVVGGPDSGVTAGASDLTVDRIHLRNWGFNGTIVAGSENPGQGTFQMQVNGFAGVLVPETVTVYLGGNCDFRYGLGAFSDLTDGASIRVVGLLLKNPTNGQVVLWARYVDGSNFTDFSTFAF
jgi:hypothetical protein